MRYPGQGTIVQGFSSAHQALDIAGVYRSSIVAPHSGRISYVGQLGSGTSDCGLAIDIDGGRYVTRLCHNDQLLVTLNQQVTEGQQIALMGYTGYTQPDNVVAGTHSHWVLWVDGVRVDGRNYITAEPPAGLLPYQRKVGANGVNYRDRPDVSAGIIKEFQPGEVLDFKGYVKGGVYNGVNTWFVGKYSGGYCWTGAFEDTGLHDLPDITQPVTPPPTPTPAPVPTPTPVPTPGYSFPKDLNCVTEVIPAAIGNFEYKNFPDKPQKAVLHDFGTPGFDTVGSVINHFKTKGVEVSSHFVVSGKRIIQMVSLKDRAYHAGPTGNNFVGIELDPEQDDETVESGRMLLTQLKAYYGYELGLIEHNQLMNTRCGDDIDLDDYELDEPDDDLAERVKAIEDFLDRFTKWR